MSVYQAHMRRALRLARKGLGRVSPNPLVGAVVAHGESIVGEGAHLRVGEEHAEIHALQAAGSAARGAVLYVTLEPCCFEGRTPACTLAVIEAGVARVECAMLDPDARVSGRGVEQLQNAGIPVSVGLFQAEAERQNAAYIKHRRHGRPLLTLKLAQSLDGCIASRSGDSRWITGKPARRHVHRTRSQVDAVMVGANTVIADDPRLDVRHVRGPQPRPIVVDGRLRAPAEARVFGRPGAIVVTTEDSDTEQQTRLAARGVEIWTFAGIDGRVDMDRVMQRAAESGMTSILLEGGGTLAAAALAARAVDRLQVYIAPMLLGGGTRSIGDLRAACIADAVRLQDIAVRRLGVDRLFTATVAYACSRE